MSKQITPLKFTSLSVEQEIRRICAVHGIPFGFIEQVLNEDYVLVEPGHLATQQMYHGTDLMENPSQRLEDAMFASIRGCSFAQEALGVGKRMSPPATGKPSAISELLTKERNERCLKDGQLLAASPDRDLSSSLTIEE
jgi:hypothetical protein